MIWFGAVYFSLIPALLMLWLLRGTPLWGSVALFSFLAIQDAFFIGVGVAGTATYVALLASVSVVAFSLWRLRQIENCGR